MKLSASLPQAAVLFLTFWSADAVAVSAHCHSSRVAKKECIQVQRCMKFCVQLPKEVEIEARQLPITRVGIVNLGLA